MAFFCLFRFFDSARENDFASGSLSADQLSPALLLILVNTGTPTLRRLTSELDFQTAFSMRMRRGHCSCRPLPKSPSLILPSLPQTALCRHGVNQILCCNEFSFASGGHCYAR